MPRKVRFAITGLQQSGKSVFITSLINNLVYAGEYLNLSPDLAKRGVSLIGSLSESAVPARIRLFPFRHHLENLRKSPPVWPGKTFDISGCVVNLEYGVEKEYGRLDLELVDYPGERILDFPMMKQSFRMWSDQHVQKSLSEERFNTRNGTVCRRELSAPWHEALENVRSTGAPSEQAALQLIVSWKNYQSRCLDSNMEFVQPSVVALDHFARSTAADYATYPLEFCPLPKDFKRDPVLRPLYLRFESKYRRYLREWVRPFYKEMTRADVLIVLVDVLRVLRRGVQSYNDIQHLTDTILEHFTFSRLASRVSWKDPTEKLRALGDGLLDRKKVRRTVFTATKADLVSAADRPVMARLVSQMVYKWIKRFQMTALGDCAQVTFCAANRATEDGFSAKTNQQILKALVSEAKPGGGEEVRECCFAPPPLPPAWPDSPWDIARFASPWSVLPRKLPARDGAPIAHIGLDRILCEALKGFLPGAEE